MPASPLLANIYTPNPMTAAVYIWQLEERSTDRPLNTLNTHSKRPIFANSVLNVNKLKLNPRRLLPLPSRPAAGCRECGPAVRRLFLGLVLCRPGHRGDRARCP